MPCTISVLIHFLIFKHVHASSRRVQAQDRPRANSEESSSLSLGIISRRDLQLLRHFIIMFCIFIGTWSPIYIYSVVEPTAPRTSLILSLLILLAECGILIDMINLYIYNRELRQYLRDRIQKCFR